MTLKTNAYQTLIQQVSKTWLSGQAQALQAVNYQLIETYWHIGRHLVEFEQKGKPRAEYGQSLLKQLAQDLTLRHGKGFSRSNLIRMRQFYLAYPISAKPSHQLSWSHYVELLKLDDPQERSFYQQQAIAEKWSVPELKRQKNAQLFCDWRRVKATSKMWKSTRNVNRSKVSESIKQPYDSNATP